MYLFLRFWCLVNDDFTKVQTSCYHWPSTTCKQDGPVAQTRCPQAYGKMATTLLIYSVQRVETETDTNSLWSMSNMKIRLLTGKKEKKKVIRKICNIYYTRIMI